MWSVVETTAQLVSENVAEDIKTQYLVYY